MSQTVDQDSIRSLAWGIICRVAPAEEVAFDLQSEAYFADPQRALTGDKAGGDRLGSGITDFLEAATPVVTPIALAVATELVTQLVAERVQPVLKRTGRAISAAVGRLTGRSPDDPNIPVVELPAAEQAEVRRIVVEVVVNRGQSEDLAKRIADAIVGEAKPGEAPEEFAEQDGPTDDDRR